jgi:TonB-linked SusC/RagA family outer membrane protein
MRSFVRIMSGGFLAALLLCVGLSPALGQGTGEIRGTVTEMRTGRPLAGVQILLEGRGIPAVTDELGHYSISSAPVGRLTLRARMIGYSTVGQELTVSAQLPVVADFELQPAVIQLDQIVVTGTGREVERRKLAATVNVVNVAELQEAPVSDVAELLQGKIAGGTVNATSAQGGTSGLINFRGVTSVFGSQTPVIYIDGVRVDNDDATAGGTGGEQSSALADLVTTDIERIEVTKGGAASTLYGSDAATGVIQIFTKRGTPGAARVTARIEQGFDQPELKYIFDTGMIYPDYVDEPWFDAQYLRNNFFKNAYHQNYYLGVSGGREDIVYSMSGRLQHNDGVQPKNDALLVNLRGSVQADVTDKLGVTFNANYTRNKFARIFNGTSIADPLTSFEVGDIFYFSGEDNFQDAQRVFLMPDIDEQVNRFRFGMGFDYRYSQVFSARGTIGVDYRSSMQRQFSPLGATVINNGNGNVFRYQRDFTSATLDLGGTFSYPYEGAITSDLTLGMQGFRDDISTTGIDGTDFALPGTPEFDEAGTIDATETNTEIFNGGVYVQEEVGIGDRLFLNAGVRMDANSTFGDDVQVEAYPKFGASYILSDEVFFQQALGAFVNTLKLRFAYGQTGKFPEPFLRDRSFTATQFRGQSAARFDNPGNSDLGPEVVTTIEPGIDISVLDQRVSMNFTYFDAKTTEAMMFVPEQPVTGLGSQLRNVGEITNKGIEMEFSLSVLRGHKIRWDVGASYNTVDNLVTDLGGQAPFYLPGGSRDLQRVEVGYPVGAWRIRTPYDSNGDGLLDSDSLAFSGSSPTPTKTGSFNTTVTLFNNLTFSASADWATGHQVFDWGSAWAQYNTIFRKEMVVEGFEWPIQYDLDGNELGPYWYSDAMSDLLEDGDWLKLRQISVRWAVPQNLSAKFGFDRASIYSSIRNLKIWSKNSMIDPELNGVRSGGNLALGGESSVTLSPSRQFRFGVEVGF